MQVYRKHLLDVSMVIVLINLSAVSAGFESRDLDWPAASANIRVVGVPQLSRTLSNPALFYQQGRRGIEISYGSLFSGLGISSRSVAANMQIKDIPLIVSMNLTGDDFYQEINLRMGYPFVLDSILTFGLRTDLHRIEVGDAFNRSTVTLSPTLHYELTPNIHFGSSFEHLVQLKEGFRVPQQFHFGVAFMFSHASLSMAFEKESVHPLEIGLGLEIQPFQSFHLGVGYRDKSGTISSGWKLQGERYSLYYTFIYHPQLPNSHGLGLVLTLP